MREDPFSEVIRAKLYPLSQDKYWINAKRKILLIDAIAPEYKYNILNFILRNAETYQIGQIVRIARRRMQGITTASHDLPGTLEYAELLGHYNEWVETTPLVKRLRRILEQDKADGYIYF